MDPTLEVLALKHYFKSSAKGRDKLYYQYRVFEARHVASAGKAAKEKRAGVIKSLITADPYIMISTIAPDLGSLSVKDIESVTASIRLKDISLAHYIKGKIWHTFAIRNGRAKPFFTSAAQELEQVGKKYRAKEFHSILADCYASISYEKYLAYAPRVFAQVNPEWLPHELLKLFRQATAHEDWATYRKYRKLWDQLPQNAHYCDCYFNDVATYDGLLALHSGKTSTIPALLRKGANVHGCPHLNSGGLSLKLVEQLADRGLFLGEALAYVEVSDKFKPTKDAAILRDKIAKLIS